MLCKNELTYFIHAIYLCKPIAKLANHDCDCAFPKRKSHDMTHDMTQFCVRDLDKK